MSSSFHWAPDFVASTTQGPIAFHEWAGLSWVILFSQFQENEMWAAELAQVEHMKLELERADVRMIGLLAGKPAGRPASAPADAHSTRELGSTPVINDPRRRILSRFTSPSRHGGARMRPVFIIDPHKRTRLTMTYPETLVRDFREIVGIVDCLRAVNQPLAEPEVDWLRAGEFMSIHSRRSGNYRRRT
jgi:alkyl hydroperoxide reductase subunit AhpC